MLVRPSSCRHNLALLRSPLAISRCSGTQHKSLSVSRRLWTTRHEVRPWRRKLPRGSLGFHPERRLATTLNDYVLPGNISLDDIQKPTYPVYSAPTPPRLWELRPLDASSPLIIRQPPPGAPRQKINTTGIPGDVDEMLSVMDACLQVGKLDRAALVLKRLGATAMVTGVNMAVLHNRYLQAAIDQLLANPASRIAEELHKWYELEIRSNQVEQTPETIAFMLKASLLTARGSRLERLVDRYMGMVPGDSGLAVLYTTGILNDQDLANITDICQTYNLALNDVDTAAETGTDLRSSTANGSSVTESSDAPEVLSTPQKGIGLRMLKQTLSLFSEMPEGFDISKLSREERKEIQARLERDCVEAAVGRWREENQALLKMGLSTSLSTVSLSARLYEWQRDLEARIIQERQRIEISESAKPKSKEDLDRCMYGPFLRQSTPARLAAVTIISTLSSLAMHGADKGVPISVVIHQLAKVAEEDIRAQQRLQEAKGNRRLRKTLAKKSFRPGRQRLPRSALADQTLDGSLLNHTDPDAYRDVGWPLTIRTKVGAALLSALIETAKVTAIKEHPETKALVSQYQPAFTRANQFKRGKKIGMILPNQTLVELMKREPRGDILARHLPMVVEPEPWSKFDKGGFLESPTNLVRIKNGEKDQMIYTKSAIGRGDMDQMLKGLDVLGKTAWRINKHVFNVMLEAWNSGEPIAAIPALNPDISIPQEPDSSDDPMQRRLWIKAVKSAENEKSGMHSVRCFMNFQLEIARAFRDQTFYFPHNIDFRGRAYPIPTYLNHMGADHVRGLMLFAKGKVLGPNGLKWLKVHLANVYGFDKASLSDREAFTVENMTNILDSATDPLSGSRWWLKAEDPWQCLATCFELKAAFELPDPAKFVSHLPVHQDGTCNGLQHYAALGGDLWGAQQVNLEPGDRPADVYSAVADLVKAELAHDLENGNPFAKALDGKIKRKVVKQTVMTNVYGVTFAGAKKQVLKQLDALYPGIQAETGLDPNLLASYIATKIFKALSTMFRGAHDIQFWLGEIGRRVCTALGPEQLANIACAEPTVKRAKQKSLSKSTKTSTEEILSQFMSTIVWTTPLRMPVVQPYKKSGTRVISTCLQDLTLSAPERMDPVHRRKQLQGFPPNFIHSLDASHMILSALECDELGLTFAAVHDSFWTHAADIGSMNRVIRDSFIRIHSEEVIGRLANEFEARYGGSIYLAQVNQGTTVEKKITALRKKKRMSLKDELLMEKRRLDLLKSTNPALVAEGKLMVTPGSIFEDMSATEELVDPENLAEFGLGNIPAEEQMSSNALNPTTVEESAAKSAADDVELEGHEGFEDKLQAMIGTGHFEVKIASPTAKARKSKPTIQIWLPLTFPPTPQKGEFDVKRLKGSDYFFS